MDGQFESYDESLDESYDEAYDEAAEYYDESLDEAEFLPGLPGIASGIGGLLGGLPGLGGLMGGSPRRPPLPSVRLPSAGRGVSTATLNTPAGSATLALPSSLVRQDEFNELKRQLQESINRNTGRLNTVTDDVAKLRRDFTAVETDTRKQVTKLRVDTRKALAQARKQQAAAQAKLRKEQSSQQMTNLMITMMMQNQLRDQITDHTHASVGAPATTDGDNTMMMLLPLMMMQDTGGATSDNTMMMAMMMMVAMQIGKD